MTNRLKEIIEKLYRLFSKYSASSMQGSPLYEDLDKWNHDILSKPLRELSSDELSKFTGSVMLTWGDANDYKHFLPRIYELTGEYRTPYEIWIAFEKLELAEWDDWPTEERSLINEYMCALWDNLLHSDYEKTEWYFMDYLSSIANFCLDFDELLNTWENNKVKNATVHLANFVYNQRENLFDKGIIEGFYDRTENVERLKSWLLSKETINRLENAYFEFETEEFGERISWAEKILSDEIKYSTQ